MKTVIWLCPECGATGVGEIRPGETEEAGIFRVLADHIATSDCTEDIEWRL